MISIICTPPLPTAASTPARFERPNIRFLKSSSLNMRVRDARSMNGNAVRRTAPAIRDTPTTGLPHPIPALVVRDQAIGDADEYQDQADGEGRVAPDVQLRFLLPDDCAAVLQLEGTDQTVPMTPTGMLTRKMYLQS